MNKNVMIDAISAIDQKYIIEYVQYETKLSILKSRRRRRNRGIFISAACLALVFSMLLVSLPLSFILLGSKPVQEWGSQVIENVLFPLDKQPADPDDPDNPTPPAQSLLELNWIEWKFTEELFKALGAGTDDSVIDKLQSMQSDGFVGESMQDLGDFLERLYEYYLEHKDEIDGMLEQESNENNNSSKQTVELDGCTYLFNDEFQYYELKEVIYLSNEKQGVLQIPEEVAGYPVEQINQEACCNMQELTKLIMPDTITSIGIQAFSGCEYLVEIQFSNQLKSIGDYAFQGCKLLQTVALPDTLTEVGVGAFANTSLEEIAMPAKLDLKIGSRAFNTVKYILYDGTTRQWCTEFIRDDDFIFAEEAVAMCSNGLCYADYVVTMPYTIYNDYNTIVGYSVTYSMEHKDDTCIIIPPYIDDSRYSVVGISWGAFSDQEKLEKLYMPDTMLILEHRALAGCTSLKYVKLSNSLKIIQYGCFEGCSALQTISIPVSVEIIEGLAFDNCMHLQMIEYQGTLEQWNQIDVAINAFEKGVRIVCTDGEIVIE